MSAIKLPVTFERNPHSDTFFVLDACEDVIAEATNEETATEIADALNLRDDLVNALKVARETLHIWHGDVAWNEYQQSPEMRTINGALNRAKPSNETKT